VKAFQTRGESSGVEVRPVVRAAEDFEGFYRREYRPVLGLAIVLSGNRSVAEELTQDAFLVALREWDRVARMENPEAWVRRVVANSAVSWLRRAAAHTRAVLRLGAAYEVRAGLDVEAGLDLWREVRRLPRRQAQTIALVYLDGLARRDVAEVLGCSEETVKTHLDRARATLSERLGHGGETG
jgi:RNA polymerase sigma-70 factor (ECF subfamily)